MLTVRPTTLEISAILEKFGKAGIRHNQRPKHREALYPEPESDGLCGK